MLCASTASVIDWLAQVQREIPNRSFTLTGPRSRYRWGVAKTGLAQIPVRRTASTFPEAPCTFSTKESLRQTSHGEVKKEPRLHSFSSGWGGGWSGSGECEVSGSLIRGKSLRSTMSTQVRLLFVQMTCTVEPCHNETPTTCLMVSQML